MGPTAFQARTGFVPEEQGHPPGSTARRSATVKEQMVRKSDLKKGQVRQHGELGQSPGFGSAWRAKCSSPRLPGAPVAAAPGGLHLVSENA